jgi:hypothetical protein
MLLGMGFVVVAGLFTLSCGEDGPTELPDKATEVTTPQPTPTLATALLSDPNCLNDLPGNPDSRFNNPTCTANEVVIKILEIISADGVPVTGPVECVEGTTFDAELIAFFGSNAEERYDVGYYLSTDGSEDARTGMCFHGFLTPIENGGTADPTGGPPFDGPYRDLEADDATDVCGDILENDEVMFEDPLDPGMFVSVNAIIDVPQTVPLTCVDPDGDGLLKVGTCTSWEQNESNGANKPSCLDETDAVPGTPSKCNCDPAFIPVNIVRKAHVKVIKDITNEVGTPGTFKLQIFDAATGPVPGTLLDELDDAGDGDMTQRVEIMWTEDDEPLGNTVFVDEDLGTNSPRGLQFYNTTYSCVDVGPNNRGTIASGTGTSDVQLALQNRDDIECTYTNDRIPLPTFSVTKTVDNTDFTRSWAWTIEKRVFKEGTPTQGCTTLGDDIEDQTLILQLGQPLIACYTVKVTPTPTDGDFSADGTITVSATGNAVYASTSLTIGDIVKPGDHTATVNCDGTSLDLTGDGSDTVNCTWSFDYSGTPSGTQKDSAFADVTWNSGESDDDFDTQTFDFSGGPTSEEDESADVFDNWNNTGEFQLGTRTGDGGMHTFGFSRNLECPDFGTTLIPNTSRFATNDTPLTGSDDADVSVQCDPPPSGCVLTQGYWKNHSSAGPAPYDNGWETIVGTAASSCNDPTDTNGAGVGTDVEFGHEWPSPFTQAIQSGECYYDVFRTQGKGGNAWYPLAHQYIAAWLNVEAGGASSAPVADELEAAADLLEFYDGNNRIPKRGDGFCQTQDQVTDPAYALCNQFGRDRQVAIQLNNILTDYNEGRLGVLHCDDDATSLLP